MPTAPSATLPLSEVRSWLHAHQDQMVADVARLAELESPTGDRAALSTALTGIRQWCTERIGAPVAHETTDFDDHGSLWVADFPGTEDVTVAALCHYDTVWAKGTLAEWPVTLTDGRLTGPGIFDMKAGLVQAVWAVRAMQELGLSRPAVRLVLNADEEDGSPASTPTLLDACSQVRAALLFEPSADGALKTGRKGMGLFQIDVRGVESHAGLDPESGASAIHELAHAVVALSSMADPAAGTSVNVGLLSGGTRPNVVAGHATCAIDVRVRTADEAARIDAALARLATADPRASITVTGGWKKPPMERTPAGAELFALARSAAADLGIDLAEASVGGGSDGNGLSAHGVPVLDGLGAVGGGAHARDEHVLVEHLAERAAIAVGVLRALAI